MGTIRLGKRTDNRAPLIKDFVPLAALDDLVFGAWDIFPDNAYQSALKAGVARRAHRCDQVRPELEALRRGPASSTPDYVKRLNGTHVKQGATKLELAEQLMADIEHFRADERRPPHGDDLVRQHRELPRAPGASTRRWQTSRRACATTTRPSRRA